MKARLITFGLCPIALVLLAGCSTAPVTESGREAVVAQGAAAMNAFTRTDPTLSQLLNKSAGYAVFPSITKGGAGLAGAYGRGVLYQGNQVVGYCDVSQGTLGLQLGGENYRELVVFRDSDALARFKAGDFTFAAGASAVAAKAGAASNAPYERGVIVFTQSITGLMFEAAIGGQNFSYVPK